MKCWICGDIAVTKEHKIKRATLKKVFNEEFKDGGMLHYKNGKYTKIQGSDSKKIKYAKSLCAKCNNEFTQPFDKSFDRFQDYIINNQKNISKLRMIDFFDIYGDLFPSEQTNLFKYFIKVFGCDLVEYNMNVPEDLIQLMEKSHFKTKMRISFSINEQIIDISEPTKVLYGIGALITSQNNLETQR